MKPAYLLVILGFLFSAALPAQSKCNPYCLITHPEPLSLAELNDYKSNYAAEYRKGLMMIKTHPVSVEFSRASILKFYETNFINSTKYDGINVFFVCLQKQNLPGYQHDDQIGLAIYPAFADCRTDTGGFAIYNYAFDLNPNFYRRSNSVSQCKDLFKKFTGAYKDLYVQGMPDVYTRSVHFSKQMIEAMVTYLNTSNDLTSVRVDFGVYGKINMACGQINAKQLTLFLTPVKISGEADYPAFIKYFEQKYKGKGPAAIGPTFNHGELCPEDCPDDN